MIKTTSLVLLLCCLLACKTKKNVDFGGTYVGDIRGNKLSMFLKTVDKNKIEGTIFDRGNNFIVTADIKDDVFKGQARDSSDKALFDIQGSFHGDTLIVIMAMQKPQKSAAFPIHFKKVFINRSVSNDVQTKDPQKTVTEQPSEAPVNKSVSATSLYDDKVFGMWAIKGTAGKNAPDIFSRNKYLFFNVNGSISTISNNDKGGALTPLKGKSWYTKNDSLYLQPTTDDAPAENLGKYSIDEGNISVQIKSGKMIILQRN